MNLVHVKMNFTFYVISILNQESHVAISPEKQFLSKSDTYTNILTFP